MAEELHWFKKWDTVLNWQPPHAEWFVGGKINVSYNCLDRHLNTWRRNKAALIWEGEPGDQRTLTYQQLHSEVCKFANVLEARRDSKGRSRRALHAADSGAGDCDARLRADRRNAFGDLRRLLERALIDRINDASCKVVVTADGGWRRGNEVKLKPAVDEALEANSVR